MESQAKKKNAKLEKLSVFAKQNKNSLIRYGLLIAVLLVFSVSTNGRIFSRFSVSSIISQLTPLMIMCVGLMFVFAHGNIDIAEGAVLAVCALTSIQIVNALGGSAAACCWPFSFASPSANCSIFGNIVISSSSATEYHGSLAIMFTARGLVT